MNENFVGWATVAVLVLWVLALGDLTGEPYQHVIGDFMDWILNP